MSGSLSVRTRLAARRWDSTATAALNIVWQWCTVRRVAGALRRITRATVGYLDRKGLARVLRNCISIVDVIELDDVPMITFMKMAERALNSEICRFEALAMYRSKTHLCLTEEERCTFLSTWHAADHCYQLVLSYIHTYRQTTAAEVMVVEEVHDSDVEGTDVEDNETVAYISDWF